MGKPTLRFPPPRALRGERLKVRVAADDDHHLDDDGHLHSESWHILDATDHSQYAQQRTYYNDQRDLIAVTTTIDRVPHHIKQAERLGYVGGTIGSSPMPNISSSRSSFAERLIQIVSIVLLFNVALYVATSSGSNVIITVTFVVGILCALLYWTYKQYCVGCSKHHKVKRSTALTEADEIKLMKKTKVKL